MFKQVLLALAFALYLAGSVQAGTVTLAWEHAGPTPPAGFKVYYGKVSRPSATEPTTPNTSNPAPYGKLVKLSDPAARAHTLSLSRGTYYVRVTAFGDAKESLFSKELKVIIRR